jgi:hypothetical protein
MWAALGRPSDHGEADGGPGLGSRVIAVPASQPTSFRSTLRPMSSPLEDLVASMSVRELSERGGRTVTEIAIFALGGATPSSRKTSPATSRPVRNGASSDKPRAGAVDTRSASGRAGYETAVYGVVRDATDVVSANDVRAKVGGTAMQARAALNRLIEQGRIRCKGKARGTRYFT